MKRKPLTTLVSLILVLIAATLLTTNSYSFPGVTDHPHDASVIKWEKDGTKDGSSFHNHRTNDNFGSFNNEGREPYTSFACWDNRTYRYDVDGEFEKGHCFVDEAGGSDNIPKYFFVGTGWPSQAKQRLRDAFAEWGNVTSDNPNLMTGIAFEETTSATSADIKIFWENQNGASGGGKWNWVNQELRFDNSLNWNFNTDPSTLANNEWHFLSVALHEVGHAVGLGHQLDLDLMDPTVGQPPNAPDTRYFVAPDADSIEGARDLYSQPRRRIAFVIDDTGSMGEEINLVKTTVIEKIDEFVAENLFLDYYLLTYKDTVDYRGMTSDPNEIKNWVNGLTATGGGDCPEEMLGALNRIADEAPHSEAWVMTDAGFHGDIGDVIFTIYKLLQAKVTVHPIVYDWCFNLSSQSTQGEVGSIENHDSLGGFGPEVFAQIASETGGHYFLINTSETQDAARILLNEMVTPENISSYSGEVVVSEPITYTVQVESLSNNVNFLLNSFSGGLNLTIFDPNGLPVDDSSPNVTHISITNAEYYEIDDPIPGEWKARIDGSDEFTFSVSGDSPLLFEYLSDTSLAVNTPITLRASLSGDYTSAEFQLTELDGTLHEVVELFDDGMHQDGSANDGIFAGSYAPTTTGSFYFKVTGSTSDGSMYERTAPQIIRVHTLSVTVTPDSQIVLPGAELEYTFTIVNGDAVTDTFGISTSSSQGWAVLNAIPTTITLGGNQSASFVVDVVVPDDATSGTVDETVMTLVSQSNPLVNDAASAITTAVIAADVEIGINDTPDPVGFGAVTYTATIINNGPLTATNVLFDSTLFADIPFIELTYESVNTSQGSCNYSGNSASCMLGTIPVGASVTVTMIVNPPDVPFTITNAVNVSADEDDINFGNNSTIETTIVQIYQLLQPIIRK